MKQVYIQEANIISPLGFDFESNWQNLLSNKSGIRKVEQLGHFKDFYAAQIDCNLIDNELNKQFLNCESSRIEKLASLALMPLIKNRLNENTLLILSTTKGNIQGLNSQVSDAFISTLADHIKSKFCFKTRPLIVSNACTSGILAVNLAKRMLQMNRAENAFVLAVDELTEFVVSGFNSFQAMSDEPCQPYDANRKGVTLGEAACAMYLSANREENAWNFEVLGEGNINDANHISGPSRTGEGLVLSIESALKEAKMTANQIDYISSHGTATAYNDEMEAIAFNRLGLENVPLNSLKAYFGHTLGASGLLELALACQQMNENTLVKSLGFETLGVSKSLNILTENTFKNISVLLKTASGFGGTNSAIIVKKNA